MLVLFDSTKKFFYNVKNSAGYVYRQSKQKVRVQIFPLLGKRFTNGRGSNEVSVARLFLIKEKILQADRFYFVKDDFYEKFPDCGLMANGVADENGYHGRPCFYAKQIENFFWLIPISSKVEKYQRLYEEKISKYPTYDGIKFGYVNGKRRAFLIQNIFPITEEYIDKIYMINGGKLPATVNKKFAEVLKKSAEKVIRLNSRGVKISMTNINKILEGLSK